MIGVHRISDGPYTYEPFTVPEGPKANAEWREETLRRAASNHPNAKAFQHAIKEKCKKSFWFWAMGFAYVHETRILGDDVQLEDLDTKVPFLPWPHQIPVVDHILSVLGKKDFRLVKSRAQGASWLLILIAVWLWLFHRGSKVNFVSKDEKAVDEKGNMDSLFAKIDWLLPHLPVWMVGKQKKDWNRSHTDHTFTRTDGETALTGYACTANVATGGRALVFFMDEHGKHPRPQDKDAMASTQPVTRCRGSVSTPFGMGGEFATIIHDNTVDGPVLKLAWWDNPTQNKGLYRIVKGKAVAVDEEKYGPLFPEYTDHEKWTNLKERLLERGYDLSSGYRSRWYDQECLRQGANPVLIAQEYDMKFGAEGAQYFAEALINRLKNSVRRPHKGEFTVNPETLKGKWSENLDGRFKLWCELDSRGVPPMGEYTVACDVSAGVGGSQSSNSAITVFNRRTGLKVASFASPAVLPYNLAEIAIALCRWFVNYKGTPAFLIWEDNGYGREFRTRVEQTDFHHYFRRQAANAPVNSPESKIGGYHTIKRSYLLGPFREALLEGYFDDPDYDSVEELRQYQMGQDGEPYHVGENDKDDPAGAKGAHGDRIIANALAWWASLRFGDQMKRYGSKKKSNVMNVRESDVSRESFAWRRAQYLKMLNKQKQKATW